MQAFAQALDLVDDPERIAEYDEYHAKVWPEVVAGLKSIGITRMRLYRTGTRLFMYCEVNEGFDPTHDYQNYATDPPLQRMGHVDAHIPATHPHRRRHWRMVDAHGPHL